MGKETAQEFYPRVFNVAKSTATRHVRFYRLCSAYPILLSTGFEFTELSGYQDAIEKLVERDKDFGGAMASMASLACRIQVDPVVFESFTPAEKVEEHILDGTDDCESDNEVEEIESSVGSAGLSNLNLDNQ